MSDKPSAILVTGAAGFIGSHTCERLLAEGHRVVGVDNFRTGKRENLATTATMKGFRFVEADVAREGALQALVAEAKPDAIVHLAALVSVPESVANPEENFRLNVLATQRVAEAARRHGVGRVVFASSAAVYGDLAELPLHEAMVGRPISPYGAAKLASEALLLGHAAAFGFTAFCLRYFNVYGPRQDPRSPYSGVISVFAERMRSGTAPAIFGDGGQTRDFIFVGDVARANALAATKSGVRSGVANICTGQPTGLKELAAALGKLFPAAPAPVYREARAGDIRASLGSPATAKRELGFAAEVKLVDGLEKLVHA